MFGKHAQTLIINTLALGCLTGLSLQKREKNKKTPGYVSKKHIFTQERTHLDPGRHSLAYTLHIYAKIH